MLDSYRGLWVRGDLGQVVRDRLVMHVPPEPKSGILGGGAPYALGHRKGTKTSLRRWLVPSWADGKDSPDRAQTLQCGHKPLS